MDAERLMRCFIAGPDALRKFVGPGPFTRDAQPMLEYAAEASLITGNQHPTRQMIAALCESAAPLLANAPADLVLRLARRAAVNRDLNRIMVEGVAGNDGLTDAAFTRLLALVDANPDDAGLRDSVAGILAEAAHDKFYALDFLSAADQQRQLALPLEQQAPEFRAPRLLLDAATRLAPEHPVAARPGEAARDDGVVRDDARAPRAGAKLTEGWRLEPLLEQARILALAERPQRPIAVARKILAQDPLFTAAWEILAQASEDRGRLGHRVRGLEQGARAESRLAARPRTDAGRRHHAGQADERSGRSERGRGAARPRLSAGLRPAAPSHFAAPPRRRRS
jgi:hypothetical protein